MDGALSLVSAPAAEPVSLADAKAFLNAPSGTQDDTLITALQLSARQWVEEYLNRSLITQTWDWMLDRFPWWSLQNPFRALEVPRGPIQSISSVKYVDQGGTTQTYDPTKYAIDVASVPPRLTPVYGVPWPIPRYVPNAVTVRFVAGYGADGTKVPEPINKAIMMLINTHYEQREALVIGQTVNPTNQVLALLAPYRAGWF